jgi:hypothetical protein
MEVSGHLNILVALPLAPIGLLLVLAWTRRRVASNAIRIHNRINIITNTIKCSWRLYVV